MTTPNEETIVIRTPSASDAGETAAPPSGPAPGSALADLRQRRAKLIEELYVDLEVPRWADDGGPSIWVRYGPIPPGFIAGAVERRQKQKHTLGDDWMDYVNADVLAKCCLGVYGVVDGEKVSLKVGDPAGPWTMFDADLAEALGLDLQRAVDVVRALYYTDGDRTMAVGQLTDWSAQESARVEKTSQGN